MVHYTAGRSADACANGFKAPGRRASAHLIIDDREGFEVLQCVRFNVSAWHAGTSGWRGRRGLNRWALGVELQNYGRLLARRGRVVTWFGVEVPEDRRVLVDGTWWHTYPEGQIATLEAVWTALQASYAHVREMVGHEHVRPSKLDPGPAFDWSRFGGDPRKRAA